MTYLSGESVSASAWMPFEQARGWFSCPSAPRPPRARDGFRRLLSSSSGSSLSGSTFVLYVVIACLLVATAGLMSGLTLGLLSLDTVDLEMILRGPESRQKKYARGIQPLMRNPHRLLVTLVVANAAAMEALPLVVDRLTSPVLSLVLSVTVVLLFGEIIPQAVCSRYGLAVGYYTQHIVRALLILLFPITWPVAKLLDFVIGSTHNTLYRCVQATHRGWVVQGRCCCEDRPCTAGDTPALTGVRS